MLLAHELSALMLWMCAASGQQRLQAFDNTLKSSPWFVWCVERRVRVLVKVNDRTMSMRFSHVVLAVDMFPIPTS